MESRNYDISQYEKLFVLKDKNLISTKDKDIWQPIEK